MFLLWTLCRLAQGGVLLYVWRIHRNFAPARDWGLGALVAVPGLVLLGLRGLVPDWASMARAVAHLAPVPALVRVDGNKTIPARLLAGLASLPDQEAIIGGDLTVPAISAASILAKTFRDKLMPDAVRHELRQAIAGGIPVIRCSRTGSGPVTPLDEYEGFVPGGMETRASGTLVPKATSSTPALP